MARPTLAPGQTYEDFPFDQLSLYAGIDVLMTGQLREKLLPALKRPIRYQVSDEETLTLPSLYEQDLCQVKSRALEFLTDLEYAGIGFDLDRYEALKGMVAERLDDYKHQLGHLNFSLSSGPQLQDYVYNVRKFPVTTLTQNNQPSTDYDTLEAYEDDELLLIARHNELQSLYNTFLNSYHLNVKRDGRIHPNYNLHGTSSHRITGNNPNLTQLPRDRGDISVRSCFTAPPGYTFVAADQSSAEVKILGAVCRDKTLLEHIRAGRDFHSATASLMLGMSYEEFLDGMENGDPDTRKKRKEFRQAAKSITFAILYGSSENTVAKKLGKDLSEVSALFRLYFENYPGIKKYIEDSHYAAKHNRFVITKLGQMRRELGLLSIFEDNGRGHPVHQQHPGTFGLLGTFPQDEIAGRPCGVHSV